MAIPLKVTAYVTRRTGTDLELLLFRHPTAGIQLPAGTIEVGERPAHAARREVMEETGIERAEVVRLLDRQTVKLPPHRRITVRRCVRRAKPATRATRLGHLRRGLTVVTGVPRNGFVPITHRAASGSERGYLVASALGRSFDRFHVHLVTTSQTPRAWRQPADGHVFRPFWARWDALPRLVAGQQAWLARVRGRLLASAVGPNKRP